MQIVIDIDEDIAQGIIDGENDAPRNIVRGFQATIADAIKNGTPLPKGHGRLIDADITKDLKNKIKHYGKDYKFTQEEILNILERYEIKYAPTIIEVDKGEYMELRQDGNTFKIVKCTDLELWKYWLECYSEFYPYDEYKRICITNGTEVID